MPDLSTAHDPHRPWSPDSWRSRPYAQDIAYPDAAAVAHCTAMLRAFPPLVTSWEIEKLKAFFAEAQQGKRFVLQGGDCAEALDDCRSDSITNKLKILLQMSMVLVHGLKLPVVRVGRFAGQYAKPRTSPTETRDVSGSRVTLPSYFGDLINRPEFTERDRTPDPYLMVRAYKHSAMTLNFIRALVDGGFADLHHPEYWDLTFVSRDSLPPLVRAEYEQLCRNLADGLEFMEALGEKAVDDLTRVEFFTSHEGLNLNYESAQTRTVPRREGFYNLSAHMPWIGERTRDLSGAHIEYFRGVRNPIGVKLGPKAQPAELVELAEVLNPSNEPGKLVFITRLGAGKAPQVLPSLINAMTRVGRSVLWVCDPMHGNGTTTSSGVKTRSFDAILQELEETLRAHESAGSVMGGVHFELTGEGVTECIGGASGVTEHDLHVNYASRCDPRLNYQQSLEMAFLMARLMGRKPRKR